MRRPCPVTIVWLSALLLTASSCSPTGEAIQGQALEGGPTTRISAESALPKPVAPGPAKPIASTGKTGDYIVRAKYRRSKVCIPMGDSFAMVVMDAFEIVEVVSGRLKATAIEIRPMSRNARARAYPKDLIEGAMYTLKLTPSANTREQFIESYQTLAVDVEEIEESR